MWVIGESFWNNSGDIESAPDGELDLLDEIISSWNTYFRLTNLQGSSIE